MTDRYELIVTVDGENLGGYGLDKKPTKVVLTLNKTTTSSSTVLVGTKEILVP